MRFFSWFLLLFSTQLIAQINLNSIDIFEWQTDGLTQKAFVLWINDPSNVNNAIVRINQTKSDHTKNFVDFPAKIIIEEANKDEQHFAEMVMLIDGLDSVKINSVDTKNYDPDNFILYFNKKGYVDGYTIKDAELKKKDQYPKMYAIEKLKYNNASQLRKYIDDFFNPNDKWYYPLIEFAENYANQTKSSKYSE